MSNTSGDFNYSEKNFKQVLKDLNMTREEAADLVNCLETQAWVNKEAEKWAESEEQFKINKYTGKGKYTGINDYIDKIIENNKKIIYDNKKIIKNKKKNNNQGRSY